MNVLLIGGGGREHALAWKLKQSPKLQRLVIAPGNAGTVNLGLNIALNPTDFANVERIILEQAIDMVVVGPEEPLVKGIVDYIKSKPVISHVKVIGPTAAGAIMEGSKDFAKEFMQRHQIPTARYQTFELANLEAGYAFLNELQAPYVLKADGLAAGKGVIIVESLSQAKEALAEILQGKFGEAGNKVVIEEYLDGIELSVMALTDGTSYKVFPEAKDYKRIGEGNMGLNTGGMGAISPVPFAQSAFMSLVEKEVIQPTIAGLKADKIPYVGFVYFGLMNVNGKPFVIEYNCRLGDPETEVILPRVGSDLLELFEAAADLRLNEIEMEIDPRFAATVMMVSGGYPEDYQKGKEILGLEAVEEGIVFHAGTKLVDSKVVTAGGRVLCVTAFGDDLQEAISQAYVAMKPIKFEGAYFRNDIGFEFV